MNRQPLPDLANVLRTLGTYGDRLVPAHATDEQLLVVARALEEARRLVTAARSPRCPQHPGAPTDPTDNGRCLFCRTTRRHGAATATEASTADVLTTITDHGEQEAARRYGPRALTLALAAAGRGTHLYPPTQRPAGRDQETSSA
ncbi:hypothetical protein [Streptomyces bacillaris]|uniref:hypothetical protein n=1 Tax=Streptomyces bacillaris TaxID=68179 RepID=UPI00363A529D